MRATYPIIMREGTSHIVVSIPDFGVNTQGEDYAEAMEMARDVIGLMGIDLEDDGAAIPGPSELEAVRRLPEAAGGVVTLVDVDFTAYRRKHDMRTVRRNVSLPSWLDAAAKDAGINVSAVLAAALKQELRLAEP